MGALAHAPPRPAIPSESPRPKLLVALRRTSRPPVRRIGLGLRSRLVDGCYWVLLASLLHLPPSAVPLVSDVRFSRSA
jgi:hypothetical protein